MRTKKFHRPTYSIYFRTVTGNKQFFFFRPNGWENLVVAGECEMWEQGDGIERECGTEIELVLYDLCRTRLNVDIAGHYSGVTGIQPGHT